MERDIFNNNVIDNNERCSQAHKDRSKKKWYKDRIDSFDAQGSNNQYLGFEDVTEYKRKKVNYDLFNNIIDKNEFEYVCKPYGAKTGELPANFVNRDISSPKIKVLLGMEMNMPFSWKVVAVNEEASTRREQVEFNLIKEYVTNEILTPIRQEIELKYQEQLQGKELSPDEKRDIQAQIKAELEVRTPEEVRKYMSREHQDPAEALAHQLLEYILKKETVVNKFNKGWKHALLSGEEIYWLGIIRGEPSLRVVNPLRFTYQKASDIDYIEDSEWCVAEYRMTPSEIIRNFGDSLTTNDIDRIYKFERDGASTMLFDDVDLEEDEQDTMRVIHAQWKSLRKIGFLTYLDENLTEQMTVVDENYKLNLEYGDIDIDWDYVPEVHEGWKIGGDIYPLDYLRPVLGQYKDLDNLHVCKLSYHGAAYDNMNSQATSAMDRIKGYQYLYDVICYRVELLMASDKGKMMLMNISAVPTSSGIDVKQWQYFLEANKIAFYDPSEEGFKGDPLAGNIAKDIDMSLASDINNYIKLAEYIEKRAGDVIGVSKAMEGDIANSSAVSNTQQSLTQSSYIIKPYFELHNIVKGNVLQTLIETCKVAYTMNKPKKLSYVLDDLSIRMLNIDQDLLDNNTYGIFVSNSAKAFEAKKAVEQLAHAALQNQKADLSDIMKIIRSESIQEAEELLEVAEQRKTLEAQQADKQRMEAEQENAKREREHEDHLFDRQEDLAVLKEEERRKTEIQKQTILSLGFNEDKDMDNDNVPDVLEVAKLTTTTNIKNREMSLKEKQLKQKTKHDEEKLKLEEKKIAKQNSSKK